MRRTHLRGHTNILKRLLIHAGGFNLGLIMRHMIGVGTPRRLQGRHSVGIATLLALVSAVRPWFCAISRSFRRLAATRRRPTFRTTVVVRSSTTATYATGC
jgi:hypothetical protein